MISIDICCPKSIKKDVLDFCSNNDLDVYFYMLENRECFNIIGNEENINNLYIFIDKLKNSNNSTIWWRRLANWIFKN